jgi:hypothetical protein
MINIGCKGYILTKIMTVKQANCYVSMGFKYHLHDSLHSTRSTAAMELCMGKHRG